jgi:hypothetical protein
MMVYSRKHKNPQVSMRLGQTALRNVTEFKYWGIICFGLMRSTHVLPVEVLAGLPPIRQRLLFLNKKFLISALVKQNDLFIVKHEKLHRIWNNSNCLPEWQIVRESRVVSKSHLLTEFDLHLVDLTFVNSKANIDYFI